VKTEKMGVARTFVATTKCRLIAGGVGYSVQAILAGTILSSLWIKRSCCDKTPRSTPVWVCDVLKQGIGQALAHVFNLIIGQVMNSLDASASECGWYLIGFLNDFIFGSLCSYSLLKAIELVARTEAGFRVVPSLAYSGYYGNDTHRPDLVLWLKQTGAWCGIVVVARSAVAWPLLVFQDFYSHIARTVDWWFPKNPVLELVVVMMLGPIALNLLQFWVVDGFLKLSGRSSKISLSPSSISRAGTATETTSLFHQSWSPEAAEQARREREVFGLPSDLFA